MKPHKKVLAQIAVEKADEALKDAFNNIDISLRVSQNRTYYAIFYSVSALAYLDDFVSKSHHYLMGQFNKRYIHEFKVFDKSLNKIYKTLIRNKESSDYDFTSKLTKENVLKDFEDAKIFTETVKLYILQRLKDIE